LTQFNL